MERHENQRNGIIAVAGLLSGLAIVVVLIAGNAYFERMKYEKIYTRQLSAPNPALQQLRAEEEANLGSYGWVEEEAGTVRLPIERAMELVAREAETEGGDGAGETR